MDFINLPQLAFLFFQCIIVATFLMLLFRLRYKFGLSLIFVTIGVFQYMQVAFTEEALIQLSNGVSYMPGTAVLFPATLFVVLLIYIKEDAIETRKLIYGILLANIVMSLLLVLFKMNIEDDVIFNFDIPHLRLSWIFVVGTSVIFLDAIFVILLFEFFSKHIKPLILKYFLQWL